MTNKLINEYSKNERISTQLLVGSVTRGINATGAPYLSIDLRDSSGSISSKKWDVNPEDDKIFVAGNVVYIEGETLLYKDSLQLKILSAKAVDNDEIDISRFVKAPPIPKEEIVKRYNSYVESIQNEDCSKILKHLIAKAGDKLYSHPAAMSVHHDFSSGLIYHSVCMADLAEFIAKNYDDVDRDILITGVLLHDFGKLVELEGPAVFKYSLEGKLLGHISILCAEIRKAAEELNITSETPILLQHMALSHHGQLEYGSPVLPQTKEALILSLVDNLDSKIIVASKALEGVAPGEYSQKVYPLDGRILYKPKK